LSLPEITPEARFQVKVISLHRKTKQQKDMEAKRLDRETSDKVLHVSGNRLSVS
jgi:hypothetical protein